MVKKQIKTLSKELFNLINEHHTTNVKSNKILSKVYDKLNEIDGRIMEKYSLKENGSLEYDLNWEGDFCLSYLGNLSVKEINEIRTLLNCTDYEDVPDESGFFHRYDFSFNWNELYKKDFYTGEELK